MAEENIEVVREETTDTDASMTSDGSIRSLKRLSRDHQVKQPTVTVYTPDITVDLNENISDSSDEEISRLEKLGVTCKTMRINGVKIIVYGLGAGSIFVAMVMQGVASQEVIYNLLQKELSTPVLAIFSTAVGASSHLGKFCLLTFYSDATLRAIGKFLGEPVKNIRNADWSAKGIIYKLFLTSLVPLGLLPSTFFGFLTEVISDSYSTMVNKNNLGTPFTQIADITGRTEIKRTFEISSSVANFISAPGVVLFTISELRKMLAEAALHTNTRVGRSIARKFYTREEKKKIKIRNKSAGKIAKSYLGITAGLGAAAVNVYGFKNFLDLSDSIAKDYMQMNDTEAEIYGWSMMVYMSMIAFISAYPLGQKIAHLVCDILSGLIDRISSRSLKIPGCSEIQWKENIINGIAIVIAAIVGTLGGLPNVFQAQDDGENKRDQIFAETGSFLTEFLGTYYMTKMVLNFMVNKCCGLKNNPAPENQSENQSEEEEDDEHDDEHDHEQTQRVERKAAKLLSCCGMWGKKNGYQQVPQGSEPEVRDGFADDTGDEPKPSCC